MNLLLLAAYAVEGGEVLAEAVLIAGDLGDFFVGAFEVMFGGCEAVLAGGSFFELPAGGSRWVPGLDVGGRDIGSQAGYEDGALDDLLFDDHEPGGSVVPVIPVH